MLKQWHMKTPETVFVSGTQDLSLQPVTIELLARRGFTDVAAIRSFLSPSLSEMLDPSLLRGIDAAVKRLQTARRSGELVCIYGDYDVDGISGTSLLVSFLRATEFNCTYFIPNRFDDGYGLNADSLEQIIALGSTVIMSVDCGITALDEARICRERGVDLIITDHHAPKEQIPDACAVINPLQPGCGYPFKSLAGVGVAFNLLVALRAALREEGVFGVGSGPDLRQWLDLVALGTIADVVPLTGQNRIYAYHGLKQLSVCTRPGLEALKIVAGIRDTVNCGQVGFRLAPRLNAAGRMESAVPGVDLLLSADPAECKAIAEDLDRANAERQSVERFIFDEAVRMVERTGDYFQRRSIVLASENWHQGVIGIVASRLVERYHRPTILIAVGSDGMGKGSGRSIPGFHLLDAISACSEHLERFGGHRYAAGIGLQADQIAVFSTAFEQIASSRLSPEDLVPRLEIDAELQPHEVTRELALEMKRLEPFGAGNPEPVLMMRGLTVNERRMVGDGHLRLRLNRLGFSFTAIAFRMADREIPDTVDVAFFPELNEWNGSSSLQLRIKDLRPTE